MAERRFVIVEYPMADTPLASFTANHPGSTIDLITEPVRQEGDDKVHPSLVLVRAGGENAAAVKDLLRRLALVYDHIEPIERDDARGTWLGRMHLRESAFLRNPGANVVTQFQHRFGAPWAHLESGSIHLRARLDEPERGELLADQMRRYFAKAGVDAQVEVREISPKDYGVWEDLVQRAIGLAP